MAKSAPGRRIDLGSLGQYYRPSTDIVVFPQEAWRYLEIAGGRKVLLVRRYTDLLQNIHWFDSVRDFGIVGVIANSSSLARQIEFAQPGTPVYVVNDAIDPSTVTFRPWKDKEPILAVATGLAECREIVTLLRRRLRLRLDRRDAFQIVTTNALTHEEALDCFARSAIVVMAGSDPNQALQAEAIGSGCLVVTCGDQSSTGMAPDACRFAHGDTMGAVSFLERVIQAYLERRPVDERMFAATTDHLQALTVGRQRDEVVGAWTRILDHVMKRTNDVAGVR